jgi:hypothetical protein
VSASDEVFNQRPEVSWNSETKELTLSVNGVPGKGRTSFYDYWLTLTVDELQSMIGALAEQKPKKPRKK